MQALAEIRREIDDLLAAHDSLWSRLELREVSRMWDSKNPAPVYIGEEYPAPVVGWTELSKHWGRLAARLRSADVRSSIVALQLPAPDMVVTVLLSEWRFVSIESDVRLDGQSWVTALLRRTPEGWRFFHYMEAPVFLGEGSAASEEHVA